MKQTIFLCLSAFLVGALTMPGIAEARKKDKDAEEAPKVEQNANCPVPGTVVPLKKAMSSAFIKDYIGCDVVVEAVFFKTGNEGYALGKYNVEANTTFQVVAPGDQMPTGGMLSIGTFVGMPKAASDILFELKTGDVVQLRGGTYVEFIMGQMIVAVFDAKSVTKKAPAN